MKIFITGATGFIGTHLSKLLVDQGHELTALLRSEHKRKNLPDSVKIIKGDLTLFDDETLILPEFDVVIHLAGVIFAKDRAEYMRHNYEGLKSVVACIQRQDWKLKRFVFASSLAAAGPSGPDVVMTEKHRPKPAEHYGEAKYLCEVFLSELIDFPTTSFRPAIVLGPGDVNTLTVFEMAKKGLGISIDGKPQKVSFVDVDDLNEGLALMIKDESPEHKKFFVAHPTQITNEDLFSTMGKVMNKKVRVIPLPKPLLFVAMHVSTAFSSIFRIKNQLDDKQYAQLINHFMCSGQLLSDDLGWNPKHDLESSIAKAHAGYVKDSWL